MENFETYKLDQTGQQTQAILDQVNTNTADIAQLRALYEALTQSEPVIIQPADTWPVADPQENVIYRVIDRVNTPPQSYSDYMWNGTAMVLMATYNNSIDNVPTPGSNNLVKSGGVAASIVFDISAYHATGSTLATYANLAAALGTDGANVPASVRKGGMSVKFVQTSDNKYVQYFLTKDEWSASESDWEKMNLDEEVSQLDQKVTGLAYNWKPGYINQYGNWAQPDGYSQYTSRKLSASDADGIQITFDDLYCIRLAYFNGNTLVSRSSIIEHNSSPYTINTEYDVYITLMTRYSGTSYTLDEMLEHYLFSTVGLETRVSELESGIVSVEEGIAELDDVIFKNITLIWESGYINQYGSLTAQDGYSQYTTQMLTAEQASSFLVSFQSGYQVRVAYYNNGTFVSRTDLISSSPYKIDTEYSCRISIMTAANNTSYTLEQMLANYQFTPTGGLVYRTAALETKVGGMESSVDNLRVSVYGIPIIWESGNINSSGAIISGTQSNYYSQIFPNNEINGIAIEVDGSYIANLAFYDNGVFVSRYGWIYAASGKVTISTQYDARIMIAIDADDNTKTAEEVASHIHITGLEEGLVTEVSNLEARVSVLENGEYIPKLIACDFDGKILHFSFDDTCWCLYDLIQNANTYTSIFDEPFFGMLKEVHDATGMVFTLNTFNEIATNTSGYYPTGFDISNVPTKFQSDFQANKGWLKFSFHAKDENTNYNTSSGAGTDYGVFVSAIYTLTGDYDCIDHVTRLGYFGGTKENCLALRDAEHGIIGFLGADDTRAYDYYLSSSQYAWLRKKGKYFDTENELFFIKTQYRTFSTGEQDVENNLCFQKVTEFFAHEYEAHNGASWDLTAMKANILSIATWAIGLGYKFEYPEKIYG